MLFAHTGHDQLLGLGVVLVLDGGIFLDQTSQTLRYLILFTLLLGINRHREGRSRIIDAVKDDLAGGRAKGVAGIGGGQLRDRADIAREYRGGVLLLFTAAICSSSRKMSGQWFQIVVGVSR